MVVTAAGSEGTCKHATGWSLLDYLIVDADLAPLISNLQLVADVPWGPHLAITFELNRRPEHVKIQVLERPKPLPDAFDDKGNASHWDIPEHQWNTIFEEAYEPAAASVRSSLGSCPEIWKHAELHGIQAEAEARAIHYAQWSRAVEQHNC